MFHGVSVFYCMTTSLANNGAGLGTLGFHEAKVRELCEKAGFDSIRRVPLENPFNICTKQNRKLVMAGRHDERVVTSVRTRWSAS